VNLLDDNPSAKKLKPNTCVACLGLFGFVDEIVAQVKASESLQRYEVKRFLSTHTLPVSLNLAQLQLWLALIEKFPGKVDAGEESQKPQRDLNFNSQNDRRTWQSRTC
jgi:tRNA pseudouridine synthase 10